MMYDLAGGPPEPGSLLELLFIIVSKRRREAEMKKVRLIVSAIRENNVENPDVPAEFKQYLQALFPFLEQEEETKEDEAKKVLKWWTGQRAMGVKPLWRAKDNKGLVSRLKRGAEVVKQSEAQAWSRRRL